MVDVHDNIFNMYILIYDIQNTPTYITSFDLCIITNRWPGQVWDAQLVNSNPEA